MGDTIVLYPSAGRGHLVSMVEFGKTLVNHHPSFSVVIIISTSPFETATYIDSVSATNPSITFLHLPSTLPPNPPPDVPTFTFEFTSFNNPILLEALSTISKSSKLIKAFVIDFFCNAAFEVSTSLNIPTYYYLACSASGLAAFIYLPTIHNITTKSLKDIDVFIDVPGLPPMLGYNMPMLMQDRNRKVYQYFKDTAIQMPRSAGLIINTFDALEKRALEALREGHSTPGESPPRVYCIGPLIGNVDSKDKHDCLSWLDLQPRQSVLFLSFGSMGKFSAKQLKEIATGLEESGVRFLWVVRTPPLGDQKWDTVPTGVPSLDSFSPEGFLERTKDRGFVVKSWAPHQVAVLHHDSVGGFVTHCGWNSILEAVSAGVPMLAWPLYAEQKVNRALLVEEIKVALSVAEMRDGFVSAAELKQRVTELMDSEKGKEARERVRAMRESAVAAIIEGGLSAIAMAKLVESFNNN